MRRNRVLLFALLALLIGSLGPAAIARPSALLAPPSLTARATAVLPVPTPQTLPFDPLISEMMAQMTAQTLMTYASELSGETEVWLGDPPSPMTILTRYSYSPQLEWAARYLIEHYQALGLAVEVHRYGDHNWPNVIATLPGTTEPDKVVVLCAHFDDVSEQPDVRAPGADDNASGTAAVLASADILAQYDFAYTIRFVHFSGEEQGLLGSAAYARREADAGTDIVAVVNMDMIAWEEDGFPIVEVHAGYAEASRAIATTFADVVATYALPLTPEIKRAESIWYSDHASFWDNGYPAVLVIEDWGEDFNDFYHSTKDTIAAFDVSYFEAVARASLGSVATLAQQAEEPLPTATPTPTTTATPSFSPTPTPTATFAPPLRQTFFPFVQLGNP